MSFAEFIDMGGHGFYVWSCYLVTLVIFVGLFVSVNMQHKKLLDQIRRRIKRDILLQQQNQKQPMDAHESGEKL